MSKSYTADVVIVGAGIAGLTLACLLAKHTAYRIVIVERSSLGSCSTACAELRVSAVNPLSIKLWEHIQIWDADKLVASPYKHIQLWDHCGGALSFDAPYQSDEVLGYIVQNQKLQEALLASIRTNSQIRLLTNQHCLSIAQNSEGIHLEMEGASVQALYIIGSDGAQSWVREQAGFSMTSWEYEHTAIVAQVTTESSNDQTARQKFTPEGPLAFLPLRDAYQSSIVWSVPVERAQTLLSLSDEDFLSELGFVSEKILGEVTKISERLSFPLKMRHTKQYVNHRIILCADAAHTIHPMAGQGLNLAMQDVLALANVFIAAPLDMNLFKSLRQYERSRKAENWQMILILEAIKRLYQVKMPLVQGVIQTGVKWIDKTQLLKNLLLKGASGSRTPCPIWMTEKK